MSTSAVTPQPGQYVQGDDDALGQFIRAEIDKALQQQKAGARQTPNLDEPQPGQPIKVTVDGKEYSFKDQEALSAALQNSYEQQRKQFLDLQKRLQEQGGKGQETTEPKKTAFDTQQYISLIEKDPTEAQRYINKTIAGYDIYDVLNNLQAKVAEQERFLAAQQFRMSHPEYSGGEDSAAALDAVMKSMGLAFNSDGLEAAYAVAVQRGLIRNEQTEPQLQETHAPQQQFNGFPAPRLAQAPPTVTRSAAPEVPQDIANAAENMSLDQLQNLLMKFSNK